jgi:hypothetical protein
MNIFYLDKDPKIAAQFHCDKHVVKMIIETAQMLSTAHWNDKLLSMGKDVTDFKNQRSAWRFVIDSFATRRGVNISDLNNRDAIKLLKSSFDYEHLPIYLKGYSPTHYNHPCAVWIREQSLHYVWTQKLAKNLCIEYTKRYHKTHKTESIINIMASVPKNIGDTGWASPPQCMPVDCRGNDPVDAYRKYYINEKSRFAKWKYTDPPKWWNC